MEKSDRTKVVGGILDVGEDAKSEILAEGEQKTEARGKLRRLIRNPATVAAKEARGVI
jgi:hypothetical protein